MRTPRFTGDKPSGQVRVIAERQPGRVVRADLTGFLLDRATENRRLREAVAVGS